MEMFTKEIGKTIRLMGKGFIVTTTAHRTLDNGSKILNMVLASKNGLMVHPTRGNKYLIQTICPRWKIRSRKIHMA